MAVFKDSDYENLRLMGASRFEIEDMQRNNIDKIHHKLNQMGVKVRDVKTHYKEEPFRYTDIRGYSPQESSARRPVTHWELEMSEHTVVDFIEMVEKCEYFHRESQENKLIADKANNKHRAIEEKISRLRTVLNDNPGIKDQWEEIMVLLRMAGFEDKLT